MKKFNLAFTLAEVLITLGIIGIVAAMTISTLMKNIQDSQYKQAWKKEFSALSNATNRIIADNGGSMADVCSSTGGNCLRDTYANYMNVTKACAISASYGDCWDYTNSDDHKSTWGGNGSGLRLSDGTFIMFYYVDTTCTTMNFAADIYRCGNIFVDTNGFKGPNIIGKDIQAVIIAKNSIIPLGSVRVTLAGYGSGSVWTNSADYLYGN